MMRLITKNYEAMCREAAAYIKPEKENPRPWSVWMCHSRFQNFVPGNEVVSEIKVISKYCTDSGVYGPGSTELDRDGWDLLYPIYEIDEVLEMITDDIIARYCDPADQGKSRFIKQLMALNLFLTKWIKNVKEPVAILFLNMTGPELWLTFFMFEKHKVMWNEQNQKWQAG